MLDRRRPHNLFTRVQHLEDVLVKVEDASEEAKGAEFLAAVKELMAEPLALVV